jgi:prevent-host-death family protein
MAVTISARDANHHFSRLLHDVEAGKEFIVTRNGVPIARISPEGAANGTRELTPIQEQALADNMRRLQVGGRGGIGHFDRSSLYDDARGPADPG